MYGDLDRIVAMDVLCQSVDDGFVFLLERAEQFVPDDEDPGVIVEMVLLSHENQGVL